MAFDYTKSPPLFGDHPVLRGASTRWVKSDTRIVLRAACFEGGKRGTVFIFNGRSEYIEKYADVIESFGARGFSVVIHDWRGQGLSTRNDQFPTRGHVLDFDEYTSDAKAILAMGADFPKPHHIFAHSMGGAIATRLLWQEQGIESAVFSAPMWGIYVPVFLRTIAPLLARMKNRFNRNWDLVPGQRDEPYETYHPFRTNVLTSNQDAYLEIGENVRVFPELGLGGPNYYWYNGAQKAMSEIESKGLPALPLLVVAGSDEHLVEIDRIRAYCQKTDTARLLEIPNARHEVYLETPEIRAEMWKHIDLFFG